MNHPARRSTLLSRAGPFEPATMAAPFVVCQQLLQGLPSERRERQE